MQGENNGVKRRSALKKAGSTVGSLCVLGAASQPAAASSWTRFVVEETEGQPVDYYIQWYGDHDIDHENRESNDDYGCDSGSNVCHVDGRVDGRKDVWYVQGDWSPGYIRVEGTGHIKIWLDYTYDTSTSNNWIDLWGRSSDSYAQEKDRIDWSIQVFGVVACCADSWEDWCDGDTATGFVRPGKHDCVSHNNGDVVEWNFHPYGNALEVQHYTK